MNKIKATIFPLIIIFLFLAIPGCGGGGSSGGGAGAIVSSSSGDSISPPLSGTASVTLTWDTPTTDEYGDPLTNLDGYIVYYGTASGNYTDSANIGNFTSATISNLSPGTWYISVTAYNSGGESDYATEVSVNII